ncbi:MAG: hypothetical protein ABEK59_00665 [Halobacteria archaeon]
MTPERETGDEADVSDTLKKAAVPVGVLILTGIVVRLVSGGDYGGFEIGIWITGFGFSVLYVWYVWLRPIDLTENREPVSTEQDKRKQK